MLKNPISTQTQSRLGKLALVFSLLLGAMVLARFAFMAYFGGLESFQGAEGLKALYLGLKFDARWAAILVAPPWLLLIPENRENPKLEVAPWRRALAPLGLVLTLGLYAVMVLIAMVNDKPARPYLLAFILFSILQRNLFKHFDLGTKLCRLIWLTYGMAALMFTLIAYAVDFGSYAYIHTRLNGTLLMFLENAATSAQMIWESYPVIWISLGMTLFITLMALGLRQLFKRIEPTPLKGKQLWGIRIGVSFLLMFAMYGKVSRYPLRWGEAFEAKKTLHAHAALNPVVFFLETRVDMDGGFDLDKVKASHQLMAHFFQCEPTFENGLPSLKRVIPARKLVEGQPNVVFIQLESFGALKTGVLGHQMGQTPFFDELCQKGLFFDRFYVPMENTSRSMFCSLTGIPDVSAVQNATRNPLILDQKSALHSLNHYPDKSFHLGGSANWAQIRGILKQSFPDIVIFEEGSYKSPVVDVWGVCDADLLLETHERLAEKKTPFWAYIQTSGNHPPFTLPTHHADFKRVELDSDTLSKAGFVSLEEFNAIRFMDFSLKTYFEAAEKSPYFKNTLFVLWADHGIARGNQDNRFGEMCMATHHIPFLVYGPGLGIQPRRVHTVGSQMDLMPTVMSLLGHDVETRTLGKDLMDERWADLGAAFTFTTFRRPPGYGLIQGNDYLTRESDGRVALFDLSDPKGVNRAPKDPKRARELEALSTGFFEWAKYLLSHNPKCISKTN